MIRGFLRSTAVLACLTMLAIDASAQPAPNEAAVGALNNFQHEITECGVFYRLMIECSKGKRPEIEAGLEVGEKRSWELAARIGVMIGMTKDAMISRMQMEQKVQRSLVNNNCVNASSLIDRYAVRCRKIIDNTDAVLSEYLGKYLNK